MSYENHLISAARERIRNLPTMTLSDGKTVIPAPSVRGIDRDDWYRIKDMEKAAAQAEVKRHVDSLKPDRSSVQIKLDLINEKIVEERLSKMTLRERFNYLEKRKLEAQLKAEQSHTVAIESPVVKRALTMIDKLLNQYAGVQSVSLAATAEAIRSNPEDIEFLVGHLKSVVGELDSSRKSAFSEAVGKLNSAQLQAQAEHSREQADYARHEATMLETHHELSQLEGSAGGDQ